MIAIQYKPAFFDSTHGNSAEFNSIAELLALDWIKSFADLEDFHQFSISRDKGELPDSVQHSLMAEYDNGKRWRVIAFIRDKDISSLDELTEWKSNN